jgi:8-oxo-dGTP pyrophosphatase MutT (NUDIX family)
MNRIRSAGVLIKDDEVLLIHRVNKKDYFVFPGGGVEEGETIEEAAIREVKEETSIEVKIKKLLYHNVYDNDTEQFFFLCEYVSGEAKLAPDSIEKEIMQKGEQIFEPVWLPLSSVSNSLIYPLEVRDVFLEDLKDNFSKKRETQFIKLDTQREK